MKILIWVVLVMILYDFSVHLIFLLGKQHFFLDHKLNYWPEWKKNGKVRYQQFWAGYWGHRRYTDDPLLARFLIRLGRRQVR